MKALYALPDHEVVMELIPGIVDTHLSADDAVARIRATNGLVPVAIDPADGGKVLWADIGDHPFQEWQFMYTVQSLAQKGDIGEAFTTNFSILLDDRILADPISPSGFIFHVSRCGSTLTAKALARSPRHVVINQGGPLQRGFWATITQDWAHEAEPTPDNLKAFRNLVLAMARRRRPEQRYSFVKFISWNTLYLDFVSRAFPDVPAVFLYREAVEVIASVLRETTAILWAKGRPQAGFLTGMDWRETIEMDDVRYLAICFAEYFRLALNANGRVTHINYTNINPETFPVILRQGLRFEPGDGEFELMVEQFRFHSKDDSDKVEFQSDSAEKRAAMPESDRRVIEQECAALMEKLDRSPDNLFAQIAG
ncbi:hypothetical protein [Iodidimonas sp. SYSU 1G8]|uniref:hypothetical protein n=1 Tax=Iodidimonas sp. SYSU 1G8 TaxID=3133967 RepID=UPI0031FF3805